MKLEEIARSYGMHDWYDMASGRIFKLSQATPKKGEDGKLSVPVYEGDRYIGEATMDKVE